MKNNSVKKLVEISLLIALEVILTRFCSINTATLRIGFGFLPIAIIAMMYGPLSAGVAYALGDLLGMMIFPNGSYFPGFTLTAFLTGVIYGLVLYRKPKTWPRIILAACIVCLGMNLCLDTAWLHILMGQGYLALLPLIPNPGRPSIFEMHLIILNISSLPVLPNHCRILKISVSGF